MADDMNTRRRHDDVRRDDLKQKHEDGQDSTRIGSTGSDIHSTEWMPGDEQANTTKDSESGGNLNTGTNAGNGGDYRK